MPATVCANKMTVVHATSDGICQAFPDVCKTPSAPSPIPLPYPNIAMSSNAADTASSVKADGNPIMVSTSKYALSTGDEAGSLFGVVSNKVKGSANPQSWSMDVKAEGKNLFRLLDLMLHNGGSKPTNTPPGPNAQPPATGLPKKSDPKKKKITDVRWSATKLKCGDPVKLETKTENYDDGLVIPHEIRRDKTQSQKKKKLPSDLIDSVTGKVHGNRVEIEWVTKHGTWRKAPVKLEAKAKGIGLPKRSSNVLEVEIPAAATVLVNEPNNTAKAIRGFKLPFTSMAIGLPTGIEYGNPYGYDLSIRDGFVEIHCKIRIVNLGVAAAKLPTMEKRWKAEIEGIWNRKWKEHREACKRGDACACPGGCCLFPIQVKCSFVAAGEHLQVQLHPGPAFHPTKWWDAGNWHEAYAVTGPREGNRAVVHAHEFGHNIGMWDEYPGGSTKLRFYDVEGSIMQSGTEVMIQHWTKHPDAARSFHKRFLDLVGEPYKLLEI